MNTKKLFLLFWLFASVCIFNLACIDIKKEVSQTSKTVFVQQIDSILDQSKLLVDSKKLIPAKELATKAINIAQQHQLFTSQIKAEYQLCNVYYYLQINDSCAYHGEKILELTNNKILNEEELKITIQAMTRLAILYANTGNHSISYRYYFKTEEMVKNISDKEYLLEYNGRLAYTFYKLAQYSEAQEYYNKKLKLIRLMPPNSISPMYTQGIYRDIGLTYFHLKEYQKAITYQDSALMVLIPQKKLNPLEQKAFSEAAGVIRGNKGQAYLKLKQYNKAKEELSANIKINCQKGFDNADAVSSLIALATIYLEQNQTEKVNQLISQIDSIYDANKLNLYFNRMVNLKALAFEKSQKNNNSYNLLKKFIAWNDSATTNLLSYNIKNKLVEKDVIKWKKEIETLNFETENTKNLFYSSLFGGLFLSIVLLITIIFLFSNRRKNKELKKLNIEIEQNKQNLENANVELQKLMLEKNNIISIVAHDLRSPLSSIKGLTQLLESYLKDNKQMDDEVINYLKFLNISSDHMNNVTEDLVEMASLEDSSTNLDKAITNISQLLKSTALVFEIKSKSKNIEITINCDESLQHLLNAKKMERAIGNLISNAIKFSFNNTTISISAYEKENKLMIKVKDFGIGIGEKNLQHIFDRFTHAKNHGTSGERPIGLGLSIVKQIVEKHNGTISVNSTPKLGSEFVIEIP